MGQTCNGVEHTFEPESIKPSISPASTGMPFE